MVGFWFSDVLERFFSGFSKVLSGFRWFYVGFHIV